MVQNIWYGYATLDFSMNHFFSVNLSYRVFNMWVLFLSVQFMASMILRKTHIIIRDWCPLGISEL